MSWVYERLMLYYRIGGLSYRIYGTKSETLNSEEGENFKTVKERQSLIRGWWERPIRYLRMLNHNA